MPGELDSFRAEVRAWLEANCPPSMRTPGPPDEDVWGGRRERWAHPDAKLWFERVRDKGWIAPTWPTAYGGGGLDAAHARVIASEMSRLRARLPLKSFGLWMLGPVLLEYGTEEQKREHLPKIVNAEIRWCQGYSEPGAGSDLASLACRAERDGDELVINGQKIWTSHADHADWMFCLVRTDPAAPKRDGISFVLIDMETPGVMTRPITLISGASPFCETFFDDVRVPARNMVGPENGGWTIAKKLLEHERGLIANMRDEAPEERESLADTARRYGALEDPILRDAVAQADMDMLCQNLTLRRSAEQAKAGKGPGAAASMFKLYGTELNKRRKALRVLCAGAHGIGWDGPGFSDEELRYAREWLRSRANSIEGGTSEIQLNIIAKRVLGLPDDPPPPPEGGRAGVGGERK